MTRPVGWRREPARHALAAKGVETGRKARTATAVKQKYVPTPEMIEMTEKPDNFSWWGNREIEDKERWAITGVSMHRDSGPLQISNFETISHDMTERFPKDAMIVHSTSWLVGWVDQLFVRMYDDNGETDAAKAMFEWKEKMEDYPVADEEDYSKREYEGTLENIQSHDSGITEEKAKKIFGWLSEHAERQLEPDGDSAPYPSEDSVRRADKDLKLGIFEED